jgi:hypothetical protein
MGRPISEAESALCVAAFNSDRTRYKEMDRAVFIATAPFGSTVR